MKKYNFTFIVLVFFHFTNGQSPASVTETKKVITTYPFSDPNPIPSKTLIYPYFRFDGFTSKPVAKEWKVVELENQFIKLMILPEVGGKIWGAWEKSTRLPFIYTNQVVKFRDVAMRGPWTSGGIEANYGIIGHTPNCATPVDYRTEKKPDGSASCYIGTFDKLTQTYWTIEINLPSDKAYFTTHSTWHNSNALEQPYYTWMNVGLPANGNLEFVYPGTTYIGHEGEFANWKINKDNTKDISFYEQNNFGSYKSYHVFGRYTDFFGAFYHDKNFGMGHYALYDEKPGKKIWIWGLSRQGMIWDTLLTDTDGQYVEVQSGRLFNQSADGSSYTPFKHRGFAPYATDEWTEYWFPVKGSGGFVKANPFGALNVKMENGFLKWRFSPLQNFQDTLVIAANKNQVAERKILFKVLQVQKDSILWSGDLNEITVTIGKRFFYNANASADVLTRPVALPSDFKWDTPYALYTLGKEAAQSRDYAKAEVKFSECLSKDPYYLPALSEMAFLQMRKMDYEKAREYGLKALSINTYDPSANFAFGRASVAINKATDAKDAFGVASGSVEFRSASYTELAKLYFREGQWDMSLDYADKAISCNSKNLEAWQLKSLICRVQGRKEVATEALGKVKKIDPLSHFVDAEKFLATGLSSEDFKKGIQQEMKEEVFLSLADWYQSLNRNHEALTILKQAPPQAEILYWQAYLLDQTKDQSFTQTLAQADKASPAFIFPYRANAAQVMEWASQHSVSWKPKYFLALIHWNAGNIDKAKVLLRQCGDTDFAPLHASRAFLFPDQAEQHLSRAMQLDNSEWRYGKLLANHYLASGDNKKALTTALDFQKRFPGNDVIAFLTAKCLLLNNQFSNSHKILISKTFLPNEGSTEGHQLYREALLMMAFENMDKRNYSGALSDIEQARQWPENLGVGKPYDSDVDERFENFLQAICLAQLKKKSEAEKLFSMLNDDPNPLANTNLLINALSLKRNGMPDKGTKLLENWKSKSLDQSMPTWCLSIFSQPGQTTAPPVSNDQTRLLVKLVNFLTSRN